MLADLSLPSRIRPDPNNAEVHRRHRSRRSSQRSSGRVEVGETRVMQPDVPHRVELEPDSRFVDEVHR